MNIANKNYALNFVFILYALPNIASFIVFYFLGIFLVDMVPVSVGINFWEQFFLIFLILTSLLFVYWFCAREDRLLSGRIIYNKPSKSVGVLVFFLQIFSLLGVLLYDYGRVGSSYSQSNFLTVFLSYIQPGLLFLIYYAHIRIKKFPYINFTTYLLTSMAMGWTGMLVIIFVIEIGNQYLKGSKISARKLSIILLCGLMLYPLIYNTKENIRGTVAEFTPEESYLRLANRLQQYSNVALIYQESSRIKADYEGNKLDYWFQNDNFSRKFFHQGDSLPLSKYITEEFLIDWSKFSGGGDDISWYAHIGIVSWFFVIDWPAHPVYIIYILAYLVAPYLINRYFIQSKGILNFLHATSFMYVFHGWLVVQSGLIFSMIAYVLICRIFNYKKF